MLLHPWQHHQWLPQCGPRRVFLGCLGHASTGTQVVFGWVLGQSRQKELSAILRTSWKRVQALSHCAALKWLQQNTFPVPSEVMLGHQPCCPRELQRHCVMGHEIACLKTWQRTCRSATARRPVAPRAVGLQQRHGGVPRRSLASRGARASPRLAVRRCSRFLPPLGLCRLLPKWNPTRGKTNPQFFPPPSSPLPPVALQRHQHHPRSGPGNACADKGEIQGGKRSCGLSADVKDR